MTPPTFPPSRPPALRRRAAVVSRTALRHGRGKRFRGNWTALRRMGDCLGPRSRNAPPPPPWASTALSEPGDTAPCVLGSGPPPPPPPHTHRHVTPEPGRPQRPIVGKSLQLGNSCWAIVGTRTRGSQIPPSPFTHSPGGDGGVGGLSQAACSPLHWGKPQTCLSAGTRAHTAAGAQPVLEIECISKLVIIVSDCIPGFRSVCPMCIPGFRSVCPMCIPTFKCVYHMCIPTFKCMYHMCIPTFKCMYHMCIPTFSSFIVLRAQFPSPSFPCGSSPDPMKPLSLKPHLAAPSAKDDDSSSSSGSPAPFFIVCMYHMCIPGF